MAHRGRNTGEGITAVPWRSLRRGAGKMSGLGISRKLCFDHWPLIPGLILATVQKKNQPKKPMDFQITSNLPIFATSTPSCYRGCSPRYFLPADFSGFARWTPILWEPQGAAWSPDPPWRASQPQFSFYLHPVGAGSLGLLLAAGEKCRVDGDAPCAPASSVTARRYGASSASAYGCTMIN